MTEQKRDRFPPIEPEKKTVFGSIRKKYRIAKYKLVSRVRYLYLTTKKRLGFRVGGIGSPYTLQKGETAIAKKNLVVGGYYRGRCRNAFIARWDGTRFYHWRTKWGDRFIEAINHPEDDNGFDCFTPLMNEFVYFKDSDHIPLSLPVGTKINPGFVTVADIAKEGESP